VQGEADEVAGTFRVGYGRLFKEGSVLKKMLKFPEGYYVSSENTDDHGRIHVLCRPNGTEVCSFDPVEVLECEVILMAFADHSEQLCL
jgi:hypothetical protein